jgi:hypothetical protein
LNLITFIGKIFLVLDFDASGKLPAGLSRGHVTWLGSFDTCQDIPDAHYCLLSFDIKLDQAEFKNAVMKLI